MKSRRDIFIDVLRGDEDNIESDLRRIFYDFETLLNRTVDIDCSDDTTIEISISSEDLIREKCRNSWGSHQSWDCIGDAKLFIESLEFSCVGIGHTDREFTLLLFSELFLKECSEGISFKEGFFKNKTLNDTTQVIAVDIWFLEVLPKINNPSSHFNGVLLFKLTQTSSIDSTDWDTCYNDIKSICLVKMNKSR